MIAIISAFSSRALLNNYCLVLVFVLKSLSCHWNVLLVLFESVAVKPQVGNPNLGCKVICQYDHSTDQLLLCCCLQLCILSKASMTHASRRVRKAWKWAERTEQTTNLQPSKSRVTQPDTVCLFVCLQNLHCTEPLTSRCRRIGRTGSVLRAAPAL